VTDDIRLHFYSLLVSCVANVASTHVNSVYACGIIVRYMVCYKAILLYSLDFC